MPVGLDFFVLCELLLPGQLGAEQVILVRVVVVFDDRHFLRQIILLEPLCFKHMNLQVSRESPDAIFLGFPRHSSGQAHLFPDDSRGCLHPKLSADQQAIAVVA